MTAIAQTLDGKETFETKKELFDYVFSQFFDYDWQIFQKEMHFYLKIAGKPFTIDDVCVDLMTPLIHSIELQGVDITNSDIISSMDFRKVIPSIYVFLPYTAKCRFFNSVITELTIKRERPGTWGGAYADFIIKAENAELLE
jgi:hypothetical protein